MIFITGGKSQGKTEFAKTFGLNVIDDLEKIIKKWLLNGDDLTQKIEDLLKEENCVIVCCEIGCGIVPMDKFDRIYRETTGRSACQIAKVATQVYRMNCGIAQRIK